MDGNIIHDICKQNYFLANKHYSVTYQPNPTSQLWISQLDGNPYLELALTNSQRVSIHMLVYTHVKLVLTDK